LHYWLGFTRCRLGAGAEPVVRRAKLLLDELGRARRGVELPLAPIHGDYKLGNAVQLSDGSWANLDLDFVRIRERLYDVAASLYWASESGANVDLRELCDAYDSSAPEPVTPDERRFLPAMITQIPLHWVATAGITDSVPEAERAMDAAEAWWARREELTW
jgi:Ser/Thr protein kinase RdoA (MazF antagonist)